MTRLSFCTFGILMLMKLTLGYWNHGRSKFVGRSSRTFEGNSQGDVVGRVLHLHRLLHVVPLDGVDLRQKLPISRLSLHERAGILETFCFNRGSGEKNKVLYEQVFKFLMITKYNNYSNFVHWNPADRMRLQILSFFGGPQWSFQILKYF